MSLRRKLLAFLHNQKKTAEYTELAYLESTGTQWIDTEIPYQASKVKINLCYTESATRELMGFGTYSGSYIDKTTEGLLGLGGGINIQNSNAYKWQEIEYTVDGNRLPATAKIVSPDGSVTRTASMGGIPGTFYLFAVYGSTSYNCRVKISRAKFYNKNDELIADLIPVLDKDLVPCMYDKVSGTYLSNAGTGEFKWKLPNQLEYLESDGNQYLNLDYIPTAETGLHIKVSTVEQGDMIICGSRNDTNNTRLFLSSTYSSAARPVPYITIGRGAYMYLSSDGSFSQYVSDLTVPFNTVYEQFTNYKNSKVVRFVDDTRDITSATIPELTFTPNQPLYLFAGNIAGVTNYNYKGKIYPCEITEGDKVAMYLIPAFDENLTPCMYDLASKQYLRNQGTGTFKYGGVINLFNPNNPSYVAGYVSTNYGGNITASTLTDTFYIPCKPNTTYLITRSSVKVNNQVWRAATVSQTPYVGMSCPNFVGGLNNDLTLTITSGANDKYLMFSEGQTKATDDLTKFTVVEIENGEIE